MTMRWLAFFLMLTMPALAGELPLRPDPAITPGKVLTVDVKAICVPGYSKTVRHTSGALKAKVYKAYGISPAQRRGSHFEVDHLVSLELGGADVFENLWPQSYDTKPLNAHVKDALENKLHALVCSGDADLVEVQKAIAADWTAAYERYVGPLPH